MKYQIIGKNVSVSEQTATLIKDKLVKVEKYINEDDVECRCLLSTHHDLIKAEITIYLPLMTIRAEVEDKELKSAIDFAIDKLKGQLRKLKTRMHKEDSRISLGRALDLEAIEEEEATEEKDVLVRAKSYYLNSMPIDEAITRMDALGHDFFLYLDKEDDRVSVVYRRKDGGYGVIQAENPIK